MQHFNSIIMMLYIISQVHSESSGNLCMLGCASLAWEYYLHAKTIYIDSAGIKHNDVLQQQIVCMYGQPVV